MRYVNLKSSESLHKKYLFTVHGKIRKERRISVYDV